MRSVFFDAVQIALKEEGVEISDDKRSAFESYVLDLERETDNLADHLVTKIKENVDRLHEKFDVDIRDQRDHIVSRVFSNFTQS